MARKPKPTAQAKPPDEGDDSTTQAQSSEGWIREIDQALKREETWRKRAKEVIKRYRDERAGKDTDSKVNILWSNTEVLKAALYSSTAKPDVRRRFPDAAKGNQASRYAAEAIERGLIYCTDVYDVDSPIEASVEDMLLPGRGQCSVDYDPKIEGSGDDEYVGEQVLKIRYHYWEDFCHGLARQWCDVPWVAFRHAMRKQAFDDKFPKAKKAPDAALYELKTIAGTAIETTEADKFIEVWEIWDKPTRKRLHVARGYMDVLLDDDDPLTLTGFFPCPEPLYSVMTTDQLIPEPEFCQYQDQALELDEVSTRIRRLAQALKWKGIYDGSIDGGDVSNPLSNLAAADDGEFLPYQNWQSLKEKGGIDSAVGFWPIERIVTVLQVLDLRQASLIQKIYEITGISDIVRGATDPRETKGAQQLKAQFGSMRMQKRQRDVQRFIRDLYRLKAEIIAEHFTPENLAEIASLGLPTKMEQDGIKAKIQAMQVKPPMMPGRLSGGLMNAPPPGGPPMPPPNGQPSMPPGMGMPPPGGPQQPLSAPPSSLPGMPQKGPAGMPAPPMGAQGQAGTPPPGPPGAAPPPAPDVPKELMKLASGPTWDDVMAILRSDKIRGYRIDIETDSTVLQDAEQEKAQRLEFMATFKDMLAGAYQAAIAAPMMLPLIKESFMFVMRTFKAGRAMEQAVEDAFDELMSNPPPPPQGEAKQTGPDPAEMEAKKAELALKMDAEKAKLELETRKLDQTAGADGAKLRIEEQRLELDREERKAKLAIEQMKVAGEADARNATLQIEDRKLQQAERSSQSDLRLRTAAQNKSLIEDAEAEASEGTEAPEGGAPVLQTMLQGIAALATTLAQGQQQLAAQIAEGQQQIAQGQQMLVETLAAPKRLIRDPRTGRAEGVETVQ